MRILLFILVSLCFCLFGCDALIHRKFIRNENITHFYYNVDLNCDIPQRWCFYAYYIEFDWLSMDDILSHTPFHCLSGDSTHKTSFTFFEDDRDDYHKDLHPYIQLWHNCTSTGIPHEITHHFKRKPVDGSSVKESFATSIFDKGIPTMHEFTVADCKGSKKWKFPNHSAVSRGRRGIENYPDEIGDWLLWKRVHLNSSYVTNDSPVIQFIDRKHQNEEEEGSGVVPELHNP